LVLPKKLAILLPKIFAILKLDVLGQSRSYYLLIEREKIRIFGLRTINLLTKGLRIAVKKVSEFRRLCYNFVMLRRLFWLIIILLFLALLAEAIQFTSPFSIATAGCNLGCIILELRGCIGYVQPVKPLAEAVA